MKSADVAGKAMPPPSSQIEADVAGAAGQAARSGAPARTAAKARAAVAAAIQRGAPRTIDRMAQDVAQGLRSYLLRPQPVRIWAIEVPVQHAATVSGYAPATRAAGAAGSSGTTGTTGTAKSSSTSSKGEWAFLDDPKLSIEDKLFMFMKLVMKKSNDELEEKMKAFKAGKTSGTAGSSGSSGTSQAKKSSGGLFGILKKVFPPLAALEKVIPNLPELVNKVATQLGPQLLGALMIPLGAPWAAPLVQKAASQLLPGALAAIDKAIDGGSGSSSASTASGSSGSSSGVSKENDERMQLMEIERMVQKTNQMFATISNVLKATHDAAMTAVNNIR